MTLRTAMLALAALTALALAALMLPARAGAGVWRAAQCHEPLGAGRADASFSRTSDAYVGSADCDGDGLGIVHEPGERPTRSGRHGTWTITAPAGSELIRASARVSAEGQGWHVPQLLVGLAGGARAMLDGVRGELHTVTWAGNAGRSLIARLTCSNHESCGPGHAAHIHLRRIVLTLRDLAAPELDLAGSLIAPGSRRGPQTLDAVTADAGAGVRSVTLELNGDPLSARTLDCALAPDGIAIRLRPCPGSAGPRFDVATASGQWRQGPNALRVCATDYSPSTNANRTCVTRGIRIDNACPVSSGGGRLTASFDGGGTRARVGSDETKVVHGRLLTAWGLPAAGSEVCIAARPLSAGTEETVLAVAEAGSEGRFRARIPAGPNREIRVAHWPSPDHALERYLTLTSRVRPRLVLSPRRTLHNGERVHFQVALPGPSAAGRRVVIEARARGRWVQAAAGRTSGHGTWSGAYRFRSTTGTRTYAFRATVPKQVGYPYESGRSPVRRVKVEG